MSDEQQSKWGGLSLEGDPHIVVGRRAGKGIRALRLGVHEDFFFELRYVCQTAIRQIAATESRPYDPNAGLEVGEQHFALSAEQVIGLLNPVMADSTAGGSVDPGNPETDKRVALFAALGDPIKNRPITQEEYDSFDPFFYAICWQQEDFSWVSFVRKTNPQQFFKLGRIWCQYSSTLKKLDTQPTFALDQSVDVVIHADDIVSFSASALNFLFTDVRLVQSGIPGQVAKLRDALKSSIPLSDASVQALVAHGGRLKSVATRIYALSTRLAELQELDALTPDRYRQIASEDPKALSILGDDDILQFDEDGAKIFLDVIEGRYFEDDWTGTPRRADKFTRR